VVLNQQGHPFPGRVKWNFLLNKVVILISRALIHNRDFLSAAVREHDARLPASLNQGQLVRRRGQKLRVFAFLLFNHDGVANCHQPEKLEEFISLLLF
jgi:hypothetical protein